MSGTQEDQTPDMMGRDAGEVGSNVDHIISPPQASVEGMPLAEERDEREDHGHVSIEHIMAGAPLVPHEVQEKQSDAERDTD